MKEVAVKLASAIKTGRTLQMLEGMKQEDLAKNRMHQHNYEKQLKVFPASSTLTGTVEKTKDYAARLESRQACALSSLYFAQALWSQLSPCLQPSCRMIAGYL